MIREAAIDDRNGGLLPGIARPEVAPFENRDLHRLEVIRRERVHERLHVLAVLGLMAFHPHSTVPLVAGKNRHGRQRGVLHARRRPQAIQQLRIEDLPAGIVVAALRGIDLERHEVLQRDARVRRLQVLQAPNEQAGAEEQKEAQRYLRDDQAFAHEERPVRAGDGAHRVFQCAPRLGPARAQRGQNAEDDAGDEGQAEGERENAGIRVRRDQERPAL